MEGIKSALMTSQKVSNPHEEGGDTLQTERRGPGDRGKTTRGGETPNNHPFDRSVPKGASSTSESTTHERGNSNTNLNGLVNRHVLHLPRRDEDNRMRVTGVL